jgi:hypothetical protein
MSDDAAEFQGAVQALLDRYTKNRVLAALSKTHVRPGPKRKEDTAALVHMGRIMTWHRNLSERAAAKLVARHLPNDRRSVSDSVIDRLRKRFAQDRDYWLRTGKVTETVYLIEAAQKATGCVDESSARADNKERLVDVVLPDDDTLEAIFQYLRLKLRAVCTLTDGEALVGIPKLGEIRQD